MSKYAAIAFHIVLIIIISLLDIAFVSQLPFGLHHLHILPVAILFIYLLGNLRLAAWWTLGGGLMFEFFAFGPFGWHIGALVAVLAVMYLLLEKVITNRSLYSISAISAVTVVTYDLVMLWRNYETGSLQGSFMSGLGGEVLASVYTIILALIVFYLSNASSRRLHPAFLSKYSL